jgi:hypothetical protein
MDDLMWLRLLGGAGFGSTLDTTAVIAFIAFAAIYLIAPVIGYTPDRPAALLVSLWLLIGYGGLSLLQLFMQWVQVIDHVGPAGLGRGESGILHFLFVFAALKMGMFLAAMVAFVAGLRAVRLRRSPADVSEGPSDELQRLREENARLRRKLERASDRGEEDIHEGR